MTIDREKVKNFWDNRSKLYGSAPIETIVLFKNDTEVIERDKLLKKLLDKYIKDNQSILDLGCGTGRISIYLSLRAKYVLGVDYSQSLLDIALKESKDIKNVEYCVSDISKFSSDQKFDVIVICGLFNYLNNNVFMDTLGVVYKHLKKGGIVLIKEPLSIGDRKEINNVYSDELSTYYSAIYRTEREVMYNIEKVGLKIISSKKIYQHRKETAIWFIVAKK